MKAVQLLCMLIGFLLLSNTSFAVNPPVSPTTKTDVTELVVVKPSKKEAKQLKKEVRAKRKSLKKQLKEIIKASKEDSSSNGNVLLIILTILIPFVGMAVYENGLTGRFWLSLLLTIIGFLPGLIYSLYIILGKR